jgi:MFS family permease
MNLRRFSRDHLVAGASILYACAMAALATFHVLPFLCGAMALSGVAWITVLSSLQVTAQLALPNWVRSRGLAVFMMSFMGSMALGSLVWGKIAEVTSLSTSLLVAAVGAVIAVPLTWRWKLGVGENLDLSPSMHWPAPVLNMAVSNDRGPVLVTIHYQVREEETARFLEKIHELGRRRKRDGAFAWGVFENTETPRLFVEFFNVESWLEHRRQHLRVTEADRRLQLDIRALLVAGTEPVTEHYVTPEQLPDET